MTCQATDEIERDRRNGKGDDMTEKEREKVIRLIAQRLRQLKDDDLLSVDRITLAFLARYSVEGDEDEQRGPLRLLSDGH
jgi:hypothetical protein